MKTMKRIVTIGGGTGTFTVLGALKNAPVHLSAIVSMADDGGSTGILRDSYGVLPPGDIRRALVALSEESEAMRELFNYRFGKGDLRGHSFGNIFLSALEKVTGNFGAAVSEASRILRIKGDVIPVTLDNVRLFARLVDGRVIRGETNIDIPRVKHRPAIADIWLTPNARLNPEARQAIRKADLIVIGPGDIYTSIIPNLLVRGLAQELRNTKARVAYLCNLTTKAGETDGFTARDFLETMERYLGKKVLDYAVFNNRKIPGAIARRYTREGASVVVPPGETTWHGATIVTADLLDARSKKFVRHGPPEKLERLLLSLLAK